MYHSYHDNRSTANPAYMIDTTLRDGEQTPGVAFTKERKLEVAKRLAAVGVREIEAGTPVMGDDEVDAIREIVAMRLPCRISAWCRATKFDLEAARRCEVMAVHISLPTSEIHLRALRKPRRWITKTIHSLIADACRRFEYVSVGAQDAFRTSMDRLLDIGSQLREVGVRRLRVADTVGTATPWSVAQTIARLSAELVGMEIGFHGHNDLGMATANTLSAIETGASSVDVTINGLGERAGNAALEQVAAARTVAMHSPMNIRMDLLQSLCADVADWTGMPIPAGAPITGRLAFAHESGIHVDGMLRDRHTYQPCEPRSFGREGSAIVLGKHSGASAILHTLGMAGLHIDRETAKRLVPRVRELAQAQGGAVSPNAMLSLYQQSVVTEGALATG